VLNPISEEFGHTCGVNERLQHGNESPERRGWTWLLADSSCSRNTSEFCRVGSEELLQSLRTASRDGANCIGNAASLFIAPFFC
jgi:hypothetical protein